MVTLDPINVNEPREKRTFTYNEEDIKAIAKEGLEQTQEFEAAPGSKFKIFENIVDKDGHPRFIEGDMSIIEENIPEGIEVKYTKWSLSGTHLMLVFYEEIASGSTTSMVYPNVFAEVNLPQWILDKIIPNSASFIGGADINVAALTSTGSSSANVRCAIKKLANKLQLIYDPIGNPTTAANNSSGRLTFDLLIDNE